MIGGLNGLKGLDPRRRRSPQAQQAEADFGVNIPWKILPPQLGGPVDSALPAGSSSVGYQGLFMSPDGAKLFAAKNGSSHFLSWDLDAPYAISGETLTSPDRYAVLSVAVDNFPLGLHFSPDGTKMYFCGAQYDSAYQVNLDVPWTLTNAAITAVSKAKAITGDTYAITLTPDGLTCYLALVGSILEKWSLSTAWDISTATKVGSGVSALDGVLLRYNGAMRIRSIDFSPDGELAYFSAGSTSSSSDIGIRVFFLPTPWDLFDNPAYLGQRGIVDGPVYCGATRITPDGKSFMYVHEQHSSDRILRKQALILNAPQ